MRTFAAALLGVLLLPQSGTQAPGPVSIEMRNVILHAAPAAVVAVNWLSGRLRSSSGHIPVFDDQHSFIIEIDDGEVTIDAPSLTALVNRAFDYKGSALSNLRITFEEGHLVQHGTLKKGVSVPFDCRVGGGHLRWSAGRSSAQGQDGWHSDGEADVALWCGARRHPEEPPGQGHQYPRQRGLP